MIQEAVVPVEFGQGVDTKTDPKSVIPGKFIRLENGVFTAPKRIQKRNGYTALGNTIASVGTLSAPQMVHDYNNELIAADQGLLLSYSSNQDAWTSKGNYQSVGLNRTIISQETGATGIADVAILGNYALYAWADALGGIYGSVVDLTSNSILVTTQVYSNFAFEIMRVKCVTLAGTTLAVVYQKGTAGEFGARTVTFSGGGVVSFSAETVITSTATGLFDIVATATGGAFIYSQSTTPGVTVATLSTGLAVSTVSTAAANCTNVHISTTSNNNIWAYWTISTNDGLGNLTSLTIKYAVYSSVLAPVLAATTVVATASPYYVSNMVSKSDSATQQTLYYGLYSTNNNGSKHMLEYSKYSTITSAGVVGSSTLFANGVIPFSHPFTVGAKIYALFLYRSSDITVSIGGTVGPATEPTLFLIELTNFSSVPNTVARFGSAVAFSNNALAQVVYTSINVASFNSNIFYLCVGIAVQSTNNFIVNGSFTTGKILAAYSYSFDFNSQNGYIAKNSGGIAVLNGALMQMYDGNSCVELGFHLFPVITNLTGSTAAGSIADGRYSYLAIFQWVDEQGNLHQSEPSEVATITLGNGMPNQVTITVTTNYLTKKDGSSVVLYRTTGAGGTTSSIYYLISSINYDTASPLAASITFVDQAADATITANSQPYTYPASSVLENTSPPPSMIMVSHNNRLWAADSEEPNTIWYSKSAQNLVGLSFSAFLTQELDHKFGPITGLAEMDEKLVIGKDTGFFIQAGDGANDTGGGSTLSFPQAVPSDVGISEFKSVITQPNGVMFKSDNGIYILSRSLQIFYIGAEVESYNSQTITSASLVPSKSQIRFLCSSGLTLVYDYIFNQWSTFTNHTGTSSTASNGVYYYATTAGRVFKESSSSYLDNATAYSLLAQTSWLSFASIQGFQRVRRLIVLGDYANGLSALHNLSIQAAYDFSTTFQSAITYAFGAISTSGIFQYRERLPQQKCDSVSLLIQETTTGSDLEYIDLTNISFEVGVKRGVNKLRGQQSVG